MNTNNGLVPFDELPRIIGSFLKDSARLRDQYFDHKAIFDAFEYSEESLHLSFTELRRRKLFTKANFKDFHKQTMVIKILPSNRVEALENGSKIYIAFNNVNHIYLNME